MSTGNSTGMAPAKRVMMHMALYWGKDVWVLFADWPGFSLGQYILSLIVIFIGAVLVEWLSFCKVKRMKGSPVLTGFLQAVLYGVRVFFAYMVMLAIMSFNLGILFAAVLGHGVGFWVFGTQFLRKPSPAVEPVLKECPGQCS
ncbi:copper transporter 6-like [Nymphaea colorata]|uniref:copper transporter 6-like n=1 Tax=Nymphaea colorata TaxID=210225 RepID=UPI00129E52C2|nr:copper transporter 6-like [Nymphaea colorata]